MARKLTWAQRWCRPWSWSRTRPLAAPSEEIIITIITASGRVVEDHHYHHHLSIINHLFIIIIFSSSSLDARASSYPILKAEPLAGRVVEELARHRQHHLAQEVVSSEHVTEGDIMIMVWTSYDLNNNDFDDDDADDNDNAMIIHLCHTEIHIVRLSTSPSGITNWKLKNRLSRMYFLFCHKLKT